MEALAEAKSPADLGEMDNEEDFDFPPPERRLVTQPVDLSVQTLGPEPNQHLVSKGALCFKGLMGTAWRSGGMSARFWLDDDAWAVIEPLLPTNQPGARRVNDRRVISGIIQVLRSGCPWRDCPRSMGPTPPSTTASIDGRGGASGSVFWRRWWTPG